MNAQTEVKALTPTATGLDLLRVPFPANLISKLPKPTPQQTKALKEAQDRKDFSLGVKCKLCGQWHHKDAIHLDYVGHAALTDRLLDCDPEWNWEPLAFGPDGAPILDKDGGMWIRLTVCGVTRLGYGHADGKTGGNATKEVIGDALRNAAMRFGAALDLWHKGDLHGDDEPAHEAAPPRQERRPAPPAPDPLEDIETFNAKVNAAVFALGKAPTVDAIKGIWSTLEPAVRADAGVIKAGSDRKSELSKSMVDDEIPY